MKTLFSLVVGLLLPAWNALAADQPASSPRSNVLFICIDDLRPQLGCYGHREMVTPAIDHFAAQSRTFARQYVQVPTCGASRAALLTGLYPARPDAYENGALATMPRDKNERPLSLPQLFKENGYTTISIGKITHEPDGKLANGQPELPFAWDQVGAPAGKWGTAWNAFFAYADGSTRIPDKTPSTEHADVPDDGYPDGLIAQAAIDQLRKVKDKPFFLAVGFYKPHLPFNSPDKYWKLYDESTIPFPLNPLPPKGVNLAISLHKSQELTPRYSGLATPGVVTEAEGQHLRHAYDSCVSYIDAQVGKVLDELDRLGLRDNTIVIIWGDHGWHLGDHGIWGKHTLYEVALHSPLIVRLPHQANPGKPAEGLVETVDIFPTLAQLCGLIPPANLSGQSFAPLLADPSAPGKEAAYGFWARGRAHTVRTNRYRFTQWTAPKAPQRIIQIELYDYQTDPYETRNIADQHPDLVKKFTQMLHETVPMLKKQS